MPSNHTRAKKKNGPDRQNLPNAKAVSKLSYGLILLSGILWGCLGIFVRRLNDMGLVSMEIVALRAYITAGSMFLFLLIFNKKLLKIRIKDIWCFLGTGLCSIVFFNYCYFRSITLTSMSIAAVLLYTAPAFVMVMSKILFGEKLSKRKLLALFLTFIGCVLVTGITGESVNLSMQGILLGLGAGFGYALYSIFSRFAIERGYASLTITFYTFLFAGVGCLFLANVKQLINFMTISPRVFTFAVVFGIVGTVIPYLTYTLGLTYVENGKASIIASIEPVTATIVGLLLYKESLTLTGFIGIVMVLGALVLCQES